jgi:NAD(P)-dependent dehydrogenase (short-subunit alcohol dehydrogenase family)
MNLGLEGKRALVSGSSSGIGAGVALALAAEGAQVVIHGRDEGRAKGVMEEVLAAGGKAVFALGDLTTDAGAAEVSKTALKAYGGIDILVNNAGGRPAGARPIEWFDIPVDHWGATYDMNVVAAVRLIHLLVPAMKERGWGRVINVSSLAGHVPSGRLAAYAAAKAAMANMTLGLSKHLERSGVTANTLSPGMIRTDTLDDLFRKTAAAEGFGPDRDKGAEIMLKRVIPQTVGRVGEVADIAAMVCFLASPHGDFITGTTVRVDGGATPSVA